MIPIFFIEYFSKRSLYIFVRQIFNALEDGEIEGYISAGAFYTIAYAMEMELKRAGIHNPEKLRRNREYLNKVLDLVSVVSPPNDDYRLAINDEGFKDIEDSCQHQCALFANCDVIVTINIRDFRNVTDITVLTPDEFVKNKL